MNQFDDFDPEAHQQQDGSKAIIALLVIMALVLLWSTFLAPRPSPEPVAEKSEDAKPSTAHVPVDPKTGRPPELTPGLPKATTAVPPRGEKEPEAPTKAPEPPPAPEPELPHVEVTIGSKLLSASFTNQDARLARLVLLDHFRTPAARRAALRERRRDPEADLAPHGLPLLGQEEETGLANGGFELADPLATGQAAADRPSHWAPIPAAEAGKTLLWPALAWRGKKSVSIKDPAQDAAWRALLRGIQPGETYELVAWTRLDAAEGVPDPQLPAVRLVQLGADGAEVALKDGPAAIELRAPRAAGWQRLAARFVAAPAARQAQVLLAAPAGFKGQVWFDEVSLVKFGPPSLVLLPPKRSASEPLGADDERLFAPASFELVAQEEGRVTFRRVVPGTNLEVTKTFVLPKPDEPLQRHVMLEVRFKNLGDAELKHPGYLLRGPGGLAADLLPASWKHSETVPNAEERAKAAAALSAAVARQASGGQINVPSKAHGEIKSLEIGSESEKATTWDEVGGVLWAAVASNYFTSIIEPQPSGSTGLKADGGGARCLGANRDNLAAVIQVAPFSLGASGSEGDAAVHRFRLYAGPKSPNVLAAYGANYERLVASRWLDPLTAACAWVLRTSYLVIPNYGIAIIILTAIVRLVLHPLSKKSQTSMQKMQKLQPQVAELRDKYKADKRRLQEETMKLYKTFGVNPMGGCLPIVLQIPVFIGLWRALQESIELRQAPFALWIQDLSQPDALFGAVNILPIASCVIMFIQQRMAPKAGDPQQQQTQKIMGYFMPVFLGWILYSLPSGLGLYFIASTLVGIGEQKVIKMHLDRLGDLKPVAEKPSKQSKKAVFSKGAKRPKRKLF